MDTTARNPVTGTLSNASSGAHAAVDTLAGAADDAARKVKPAIDHVASIAHQAVDKVAGAAAPTADWLADQGSRLDAKRKKVVADTCSYISAHPLKAIGIAVVAGYLLSRSLLFAATRRQIAAKSRSDSPTP